MKYKCIILDVGYTLIKHDDEEETKLVSKILDIPYDEEFKKQIADFWKKAAENSNDIIMTEDKYIKIIEEGFPILKKYNKKPQDLYKALCEKAEIGIYDDVIETLNYLKSKNMELITLSNWFEENQKEELTRVNIIKYFSNVYGWDNSYAKPNPQIINEKILNRYKKEEILFVGDGLEKDIKCAERAGIESCWINRQKIKNNTSIKPTYEVETLLQMKNIV